MSSRWLLILVSGTSAVLGHLASSSYWKWWLGNGNDCEISLGTYEGPLFTNPKSTISSECLVGSKFMELRRHTLRTPGALGIESSETIDDWLFVEYHDRINVLAARDPLEGSEATTSSTPSSSMEFEVFRQTKYALGVSSLAVVGGIIEQHEEPEVAARRELEEEMGLVTSQPLVSLGRFRTDSNRGLGWVNAFLAVSCVPSKERREREKKLKLPGITSRRSKDKEAEEVGKKDSELQRPLVMDLNELRAAASRGEFREVQWSNTVALALLHLEMGLGGVN